MVSLKWDTCEAYIGAWEDSRHRPSRVWDGGLCTARAELGHRVEGKVISISRTGNGCSVGFLLCEQVW